CCPLLLFLRLSPLPVSTLFPYTTLFRSSSLDRSGYRRGRSATGTRSACRRTGRAARTRCSRRRTAPADRPDCSGPAAEQRVRARSEEHTSELQSRSDLVCRLLLEKKKKR